VSLEDSVGQDERNARTHSVSLEKCFRLFTKQEVLSGDNAWYCRNCKEHVSAQKEIQLWSLPRILVVGLKRFAFRGGAIRSKINDYVDFPIDGLNLREYCGAAATEGLDEDKYIYDLFAVCNHFGRMGFGHYTSHVREWSKRGELTNQWLSCDDENVSPCREEEVKTNAAYILFYIRRG
jgi:ubiquitin carboxyl-terminal hydrolase 4/11/15